MLNLPLDSATCFVLRLSENLGSLGRMVNITNEKPVSWSFGEKTDACRNPFSDDAAHDEVDPSSRFG